MNDLSDDSFKQFLIVSLILHISFFLFFTVKNILLPNHIIEIPRSIRVDVVDLPDKIDPDQRPNPTQKAADLPKPETPKVAEEKRVTPPEPTKAPEKVNLEKNNISNMKETQKRALDKLKAQESLERIKNEMANKKLQESQATTPKFKGNIITSGNDFTGLSKLKVNDYLNELMSQVRQNWELPQWLSSTQLKATLIVQIDSRGYVIRNEIQTSSGNKVFDATCVNAVQKSSPFSEPPNEVKDALIMIRFPFE